MVSNTPQEKIRKEYYRRIRMVLKTELNSKNRIQAINSLAIPVVQYSFNIINWNISDLQRLDRKTRKLLTCSRMLHPKSDVDRLYLPRSKGGRGLLQVEMSYRTSTIGMNLLDLPRMLKTGNAPGDRGKCVSRHSQTRNNGWP